MSFKFEVKNNYDNICSGGSWHTIFCGTDISIFEDDKLICKSASIDDARKITNKLNELNNKYGLQSEENYYLINLLFKIKEELLKLDGEFVFKGVTVSSDSLELKTEGFDIDLKDIIMEINGLQNNYINGYNISNYYDLKKLMSENMELAKTKYNLKVDNIANNKIINELQEELKMKNNRIKELKDNNDCLIKKYEKRNVNLIDCGMKESLYNKCIKDLKNENKKLNIKKDKAGVLISKLKKENEELNKKVDILKNIINGDYL